MTTEAIHQNPIQLSSQIRVSSRVIGIIGRRRAIQSVLGAYPNIYLRDYAQTSLHIAPLPRGILINFSLPKCLSCSSCAVEKLNNKY
jgi:hypothetical protein